MTFARLFSEATIGELPRSGDVVAVGLPLLRQVQDLHRRGLVTGATGVSALDYDGALLTVRTSQPAHEAAARRTVDAITAEAHRSGVEVSARRDLVVGDGSAASSRDVFEPDGDRPERPMFVRGYRVWEQLHGHHDELTDVALVGQWLCSYAFGLDLESPDDIDTLAQGFRRPSVLNPALHPVLAGALAEMVHPDRSRRPSDLGQIIARVEHHRDLPADLDLGTAYLPGTDWRRSVLTTLRDRVFDTTRRNRELYFRPTATSVSLTEASVPLLLDVQRITPGDLLTWSGSTASAIRRGEVDLAKWCRFEEAPYLAPTLDKLISAERKTTAETGHGRLRLIIAFLRWYDPQAEEAVVSPLLTLPAVLRRKKGVETRYRLDASHDEALVNPVLRHVFASRFDITLPETVSTTDDAVAAFVAELEASVRRSSPAVSIELVDKPRVELLRRRAQLRVDTYRRRRARSLAASGRWRRQDFSYDLDDWRPLGKALYDRFVEPAALPLRDLAGATPRPRPQALADESSGTRTSESYSLGGGPASVDRWQVDLCSVSLAMLGSRRTSLARDYDAVTAEGDTPPLDVTRTPFEDLFHPGRTSTRSEPAEPLDVAQLLVLPADDAQARAVRRAVRGDSFIIQGPPGTGKSQTIANVIAAVAAEGRRVLFVCEKRAAIDVVAHRLDQVGLGDLTALIHDSQLDKKQFVADLGATYHSWLDDLGPEPSAAERDAARPAERRRNELLAEIHETLAPIRALVDELTHPLAGGPPVAAAIERLAHLTTMSSARPDDGTPTDAADNDTLSIDTDAIDTASWTQLRPALDRVQDALAASGLVGPLGSHAGLRIAPGALGGQDPIAHCRKLGAELSTATADLDPSLRVEDLASVAAWMPLVHDVAGADALVALDPSSPRHLDLREAARRQEELASALAATSSTLERWAEPLSPADTDTALEVARAKEGSFLKFLSGRWRSVRATVERHYRFDAHEIRPTVTSVLEELDVHHAAANAVAAHAAANTAAFGHADATALRTLVDEAHGRPAFDALVGHPDPAALAARFRTLATLGAEVLVGPDATVADLARIGVGLAGTPVAAEGALLAWAALGDPGHGRTLGAVLDADTSLDRIEADLLRAELGRWRSLIDDHRFGGPRIDDAVAAVGRLRRELLGANAAVVLERTRTAFWANIAHSEASMAGRSPEDKAAKKAYNAGRRVVEREAEKKMRHRSIREMASGDSRVVVRDLRPIWLMSPLSVSDTLPLDLDLFDVVIFDEASQIPVEDAIPSVLRAPQVIVVGDRMQMPPTRFFSSDDSEDDEIVVDDHGHRLSISLDSDSFLTQAELALGSSMLNWHYRSRSESLIAYSNHAFYDGRLATVPDIDLPSGPLPALEATDAPDAAHNAAETLARPISFHHLDHGRYRDRRNEAEADYIAELVRAVLRGEEGLTIGIVAFSEAQQGAIETALEDLAAVDVDFAARYEEQVARTDDGEFVGLFVKNLENVQGDERDLIVMSVCYGPDPEGRIRMNFGPINNAGGERRLNVIFSRAKRHMAVVTSMRGADITNLHNDGAAHLAGFLRYAEAESVGALDSSSAQLRALAPAPIEAAEASGAVVAALADRLRSAGWTVETGVGRSAFRIDVALASGGRHRLGVLLEPGAPATDLVAPRYVAEAGVLAAFGWQVVRVPLSDWLADPDRVVERIEVAAAAAGVDVPGDGHVGR